MTVAGALYISRLSRVTRTVRQAWTVGLLLLVTLVLAKVLVAVAPQSLYLLGTAPTLMATILLVIAYNQRFALGVAVLHGLLVTFTLEQGIGFYLPLLAGAVTFIFGLGEIRTRGKLIEVGCVASAVMFLRALRPQARITVYTPSLPLSRGESFLENRVFADPDDVAWESLDLQTRRDFVKHCDRGVFDASVLARIADDEHCSFVTGRVVHFAAAAGGERVSLEYESPDGVVGDEYDFVVNSTGFDLLTQLHGLFPEEVRAEIERRCGPLWDRPPEAEIRFGRGLELEGMTPRLHIPGLAGLSQGPGFANLGSLGLLANRVLAPLLAELGAPFAGKSGSMLDQPLLID